MNQARIVAGAKAIKFGADSITVRFAFCLKQGKLLN
jgi:hypothetical protein